ncbi:MAG: hypothetical protein A2017_10690 [Lentisphaerae bacterium GWF2_44_16]|nr:MAG: hypothetical protein A2017_10690 [Lentisphaerae bacterium GWF2_44_16]
MRKKAVSEMTRRDFIKVGFLTGAALSMTSSSALLAQDAMSKTDVWVIHGKDKKKMMEKCMEIIQANGSFGKNVKTLALKVNSAWARTPEEGANTHPELVDAFLKACKNSGIQKVVIPENPCDAPKDSFTRSGIYDVAQKNGVDMIDLRKNTQFYRKVTIPKGVSLKNAEVAGQFLDSDAVVNMPVAKHHGAATLSIAMKNWMGAVRDRRYWHGNNMHQCIADFCTFMKPAWTIIDATRTMMSSGPKGPGRLQYPDLLIVSKDQVAADAFAATLFHDSPEKVGYLRIAGEMGIGNVDLKKMNIHRIEV